MDLRLRVRFIKPGYVTQDLNTSAFTVSHPGKNWAGKSLWPSEARVETTLVPVAAPSEQQPVDASPPSRYVWVAGADASDEVGQVAVRANIADAEVWVNGRRIAATPAELILQQGQHTIEIRKAGYRSARRSVLIQPDARLLYEATLEPQP